MSTTLKQNRINNNENTNLGRDPNPQNNNNQNHSPRGQQNKRSPPIDKTTNQTHETLETFSNSTNPKENGVPKKNGTKVENGKGIYL